MLEEAGQADVQITRAMIAAGRDAILRELTHPERDDIGPYTADRVAKSVFTAMSEIKQGSCECRNVSAECHEPSRHVLDLSGVPGVVVRELEAPFAVPRSNEGEPTHSGTSCQHEGYPVHQTMCDAVTIQGQRPDLAEQIVERMFPRLIWVVKEELKRGLLQAGETCRCCGVALSENSHGSPLEWRSPENGV
jgi:hypothetical protein